MFPYPHHRYECALEGRFPPLRGRELFHLVTKRLEANDHKGTPNAKRIERLDEVRSRKACVLRPRRIALSAILDGLLPQ